MEPSDLSKTHREGSMTLGVMNDVGKTVWVEPFENAANYNKFLGTPDGLTE